MAGDLPQLSAPEPLADHHHLDDFRNKHPEMERWLKEHARNNQRPGGGSVCYVVCAGERVVVGYYVLAAGSVEREAAPRKLRHNTPKPLPVVVLGRLAVDANWAGRSIGTGMLNDAINRVQAIAKQLGTWGMVAHAIDEEAKHFYLKYGFIESPLNNLTVLLPIRAMEESLR